MKKDHETYSDLIREVDRLINGGRYEESIDLLRDIYRNHKKLINSNDGYKFDYDTSLALTLYKLDRFEEALELFNQLLEHTDRAPNIRFMRAKCHDYLDQLDDAERDYRRVIEIDPSADCAHAFLGLVLENKSDYSGAKKAYLAALELDPDDPLASERLKLLE